jgi:hypothetical protein
MGGGAAAGGSRARVPARAGIGLRSPHLAEVLATHPAVPWSDRVWQANQPEADPEAGVDLAAGGVALEVRRRDSAVTFRHLARAEFAFRFALDAGTSLETAADAAMMENSRFDLTEALRALLGEALLVGLTCARAKGDSR